MAITALPTAEARISERVAEAVREGLASCPKRLPPWLFYDEEGSRLFDRITELPEYYLTRTERAILTADAGALIAAQERLERELPEVLVAPQVMDYCDGLILDVPAPDERRLVLYIGSSIGNFEPNEAARILDCVRAALRPGDGFLLGVDLVKRPDDLLAAYNDAEGVTAAFNRNILVRINHELGADFDPIAFGHRAVWNATASRMEMHLASLRAQTIRIEALDLDIDFRRSECIHTENSYKYMPGQAEAMLAKAAVRPNMTWTGRRGWFSVVLGRVE